MHEELVNILLYDSGWLEQGITQTEHDIAEHLKKAADAIEELEGFLCEAERDRDEYRERLDKTNDILLNRWIPVTERLPEEYVSVLCYCSRNGQYGCGDWCKEDNGTIYWIGLNGMIPTHWLPLPEPPKEEV